METLRLYLNSLSTDEQKAFALRCGTSLGYLRKAISCGHKVGSKLAIDIERESDGTVTCESLLPEADWRFLRNTA
jgi:DNA-binding transcriptional regulator YdaS (Cro superfamily)